MKIVPFMNLETLCVILQYSNFDKPFILITDASGYVIRGVLSQDFPVACASCILSDAEKNIQSSKRSVWL